MKKITGTFKFIFNRSYREAEMRRLKRQANTFLFMLLIEVITGK